MLSVQKLLSTTTQYSSSCVYNKTFIRYTLGHCNRLVVCNYGQWVPEHYLVTEKSMEKYKIDPAVKALSRRIIYSEYMEKKSLNQSYQNNQRILKRLKKRAKDIKFKDLMETPAFSTALKYLRDDLDRPGEIIGREELLDKEELLQDKEFQEEEECIETARSKPIHMPYASTDRYDEVEELRNDNDVEISELNQEYKELYEKYLESKDSAVLENLTKTIEANSQSAEKPSNRYSRYRPMEDTRKVPPDWMTDYEQYNDDRSEDYSSNYGTANPNVPVSSIPCGGCGALLHCQDSAIPGYLPSELFINQSDEILRSSVCQRCHFMNQYKTTLEVTVSPEEYPSLLSHIRKKKVAVIMMVDLMDFPCSIWPGIKDIVGKSTQIFVVGNKVDLLPNDGPNFLKNVEESLLNSINEMGIDNVNIKGVTLISAKTGYGVEQLINKLHKIWEYKGDVYLIGCTNVGKSSLFNALLRSDYCKVQAADLIQRATISPWPGTTLNLLKFPILNPVRWRLWMRTKRILAERNGVNDLSAYRTEMFKDTKKLHFATLQGHIGNTFAQFTRLEGNGYFGQTAEGGTVTGRVGFNENKEIYKESRWCYDTPGAILPDQVLHFLTTEELMLTLPRHIISPRTFVLYKSQTLFLAGLGRLDFIKGCYYIKVTIFACRSLPVTICATKHADSLYEQLLTTEAFVVPKNDPERLKVFPALESKKFQITTIAQRSAADVVLSSAGWIAITGEDGQNIAIQAWTPQGRGIYVRSPSMLSRSVSLRGYRIPDSQAYTRGRRVYTKN